ncbi:amino acid ABC transporter substrate-binding protein (PAAT family) [Pseudonocardia hierapolitana]|uniref:Amino acid ABC transporter substrate-binding protein (PAAT family) n=1 Tax=Pseudonocardia hierapolitana TaxID=1128676 RepID=A0A561SQI2_9PSEU|nr:ABC transporter substrate-binding protein [Pseudonocardia hierapolitana]TWF77115.1 amino acid ABC transporter substrate-binding protein (PAAT family) [Pseudonocardia hierapolitana]
MISSSAVRRVLAVAALVLAAACAPEPAAPPAAGAPSCEPGALPTLTSGTLTFGTDQPVYPPWYLDDDPASGRGFEGAVAYAIADGLGYPREKVTWVRVPFNASIQPGPKSYDLNLTEFSITAERAQAVDFSAPYYDVKQAVVAMQTGAAAAAGSIADLKGLRLGAQVGTTSYQAILDQIAPTGEPAVFNTNDDAKLALSNGQVDAIVVDLPTAFYITSAELEGAKIVGQLPLGSGTPEQFGAVLDKDSPLTACVSAVVEKLRGDGTLAALEDQWLASAETAPELR